MNKYLITPGMRGMVQLKEDETMEMHDYTRSDIDWIYEVPADGVLTVSDTDIQNKEVKKDDIIIVFYERKGLVHRAIVIDNTEWKENLAGIRQYAIDNAPQDLSDAISETISAAKCNNCDR